MPRGPFRPVAGETRLISLYRRRSVRIAFAVFVGAALAGLAWLRWSFPARLEASMNRTIPHAPYPVSARAAELHDSLFIADLHNDALLWNRDLRERSAVGHSDLPRLRDGNVALQVFSAVTKSPSGLNLQSNDAGSDRITLLAVSHFWPPRTWSSPYERAAWQLDRLQALADDGAVLLVRTRGDLVRAARGRRDGETLIAALFAVEGAHALEGDLDNLDRLFASGMRMLGLAHFFDNELAGSLHGTGAGGLTPLGRAAVQRANELGVIIDVAHASPATVRDVLSLSTAPPVLSHGGLQGACASPRNLDDELMAGIAASGGIVGIGFWRAAVCGTDPAAIAASIRYAVDRLGIEHVALGSDFDGTVTTAVDASELAAITQALLDDGFDDGAIRAVMGDNLRRFLLEHLPDDTRADRGRPQNAAARM